MHQAGSYPTEGLQLSQRMAYQPTFLIFQSSTATLAEAQLPKGLLPFPHIKVIIPFSWISLVTAQVVGVVLKNFQKYVSPILLYNFRFSKHLILLPNCYFLKSACTKHISF